MKLTAHWQWQDSEWRCGIHDIHDSVIPDGILRKIVGSGPPGSGRESIEWVTGKKVGDILLGKSDRPAPLDLGGPSPIEGVNASVSVLTSAGGKVTLT